VVRYGPLAATLSPLDQVRYPAGEGGADYDVLAVHEIGRREGLRVLARRRADE
jgi:hypothetical protein